MFTNPIFAGCATALVTPMRADGSLDENALRRLIAMQLEAHMDAIVVLGTTGEPCTLSMDERERVIAVTVELCKGKMPIIVGTGSNDTHKAVLYARQAHALGADAQLCVTPYYNKATQEGLLRHYGTILDACELAMILYNVPSRTGMNLSADTAAQLAVHPGVVGLKEASGDMALVEAIAQKTDNSLPLYSGNDDLTLQLMAMGAAGSISVASNVVPELSRAVTSACLSGDFAAAREAQTRLIPLINALFSQVSPIPVKAALSMMGLCDDVLRLPLTPMEEPHRSKLREVLRKTGLLSDLQ